MTLRVWSYDGCSTCRKAKAWLEREGLAFELVPIVEQPPSAAELRTLWQRSGLPLRRFFNTSGQSYRQGGFSAKLGAMTDDEALAALAADGKLIKRPLAASDDAVLVGFDADAWGEAFATR
ncbi:MAG: arsenate reductase family protein [Myxococcales bacterium]|nr:arsenate reductase family protein [Myxococcales bacterium]